MNAFSFKETVLRFLRGFVAGGIASVIGMLALGVNIRSLADLQALGFTMLSAFITGGLLALDKALRGEPVNTANLPVIDSIPANPSSTSGF